MNRNYKRAAGVIIVLVVIGGMLLFVNRQQTTTPPANRGVCKTIKGTEHCTGDYIGLTEPDAVQKAKDAGLSYRIVARNGETFPITEDFNEHRLNFTIENDRVTKAEFY